MLLSRVHGAALVDISHQVPFGDVRAAQYILSRVWHRFPSETVHLAVVDPGVGTERRARRFRRRPLLRCSRQRPALVPPAGRAFRVAPGPRERGADVSRARSVRPGGGAARPRRRPDAPRPGDQRSAARADPHSPSGRDRCGWRSDLCGPVRDLDQQHPRGPRGAGRARHRRGHRRGDPATDLRRCGAWSAGRVLGEQRHRGSRGAGRECGKEAGGGSGCGGEVLVRH